MLSLLGEFMAIMPGYVIFSCRQLKPVQTAFNRIGTILNGRRFPRTDSHGAFFEGNQE
jgi:hypothetical protein